METIFYLAASIGVLTSAVALVYLAVDIRQLRIQFKTSPIRVIVEEEPDMGNGHHMSMGSTSGYSIYVYRNSRWVLEADLSSPGYEPTPPTVAGSYDGQVVKKEAVPVTTH